MTSNIKKTLKIYWEHTKGHRLFLFLVIFTIIGSSVLGVIIPLYFKKFFDLLSDSGDKNSLYSSLIQALLMIAGLEIGKWTLQRISIYFSTKFQTTVVAKLAETCFGALHKHSFSYFNNNFVGAIVKRFNWFTRAFESVLDKIIWTIIPLLVNVSLVIFILTGRNPLISIFVGTWLVIFLLINWTFTKYKFKFDLKRTEAESKVSGILADTITNQSNVKLFTGYERESQNFSSALNNERLLRVKSWNLNSLFDGIQGFLAIVLEIGIFYVAIGLWRENKITLGDFVLIQTYIMMIFYEIWNFGRIIRYLITDLTEAEEMTKLLTTPVEIRDVPEATDLYITKGEIQFENVEFNYHETRKIISGLNLNIKSGEKIALVGHSGAGKTTLIKLLLRMHEVSGGKILIDGQKINKIKQNSLWSNISLVPQDPILFHRSLMENIRYGKPDASDEEVINAAKSAHCHEFILELPDKYETHVGERGVKLSGGERQRVAIARAILRNAPILILDEATSSLDSESEMYIQDALNILMDNKTVIVIAHRLSTIMKMDRIIVLDHGIIIEEGSHYQLLKRGNGIYKQLWNLQAGGFITDKPAKDPTEEKIAEEIKIMPGTSKEVVLSKDNENETIEPGEQEIPKPIPQT